MIHRSLEKVNFLFTKVNAVWVEKLWILASCMATLDFIYNTIIVIELMDYFYIQ